MSLTDLGIMTPYSTVMPLVSEGEVPTWTPEDETERIASYQKYDQLYWNHPDAFRLVTRGAEDKPIYIPEPRRVVDTTAYYILKGLTVQLEDGDWESPHGIFLKRFLEREVFIARFHTAKQAGVTRGDYVFHVTADPTKPENTRVSINSVDPASYFPIFDPNDPDKRIGVDLVDKYLTRDNTVKLRRQRYEYVVVGGRRQVVSSLKIVELKDWWDNKKAEVHEILMDEKMLPAAIQTIPVYAFKNIDWDGDYYGSSELRGFENLFASINQATTDEAIALALEGLGVYATDAGTPENEEGEEVPWEISPGRVLEIEPGSEFKRVEGVGSIKPMQDHIGYLTKVLHDTAATFETSLVDVQVAESGIARAIRFLPTLAKIETRDEQGLATLRQMWWDMRFWFQAYENVTIAQEIIPKIGEKLPQNRTEQLNELNNMMDRKVISRAYYRKKMKEFGYEIPEDMEDEVLAEEKVMAEARVFQEGNTPENKGNQSNNKDRPNESSGTEASNGTTSAQQRRRGERA